MTTDQSTDETQSPEPTPDLTAIREFNHLVQDGETDMAKGLAFLIRFFDETAARG